MKRITDSDWVHARYQEWIRNLWGCKKQFDSFQHYIAAKDKEEKRAERSVRNSKKANQSKERKEAV